MLDAIEERMKQVGETTATQLMKCWANAVSSSHCTESRQPGRHWGGLPTSAGTASWSGTPTKKEGAVGEGQPAQLFWQNLCQSNLSCCGLEYQRREPQIFSSWVAPWIAQCSRKYLLPLLCEQLPNGKFQQDNAPCHTSKGTQVFPNKQDLKCWRPHPRAQVQIWSKICGTRWSISFKQQPNPVTKRNSCKAYSRHRGTGKVLQIYRTFEKGHAQSYRSERRSYRLLTYILYNACVIYFFLAPVLTREAEMMVKVHMQEVRWRPQFPGDVCYKHCGLLSQLFKMAVTFARDIFKEISMHFT